MYLVPFEPPADDRADPLNTPEEAFITGRSGATSDHGGDDDGKSVTSAGGNHEPTGNHNWIDLWRTLVDDPRFLTLCRRRARTEARRRGISADDLDDLVQDTLIGFADSMRSRPTFGFDPRRGSFEHFLHFLVGRHVRTAADRWQRGRNRVSSRCDETWDDDPASIADHRDAPEEWQRRVERVMAINRLNDPIRYVMSRWCDGGTIAQIADELGRSHRTVHRHLDRGCEALREMLG